MLWSGTMRSSILKFGKATDYLIHGGKFTPDAIFDTYCGMNSKEAFCKPFTATTNPQQITCQECKDVWNKIA
jgi:hypothetical protein